MAQAGPPAGRPAADAPGLDEAVVHEVASRLSLVVRGASVSDPRPVPVQPTGRRVSPPPVLVEVTWGLEPSDVRSRLRPGLSYRPLVWLGSGHPDFSAGEATLDGVLVGAICSRAGDGDGDGRDRVELRFWAQVDLGDLVAPGDPVTLLEGERTVARGVVVDGTT